MALPRAQSFHDARPISHSDAPPDQRVFLKGRYAIRRDGVVLDNNWVINQRSDMTFVDELPQYHIDQIREAKSRDLQNSDAKRAYEFEEVERRKLQEQRVQEAIARHTQQALDHKPSAETDTKSAKHIIANAATPEELATFVESAYGKRLDRRKALNTLRHEADTLRVAAESAPIKNLPDDNDRD